eukprot:TRINITY_DN6506_c0_g1_i1.p1 TRINITY_DN6506_c0_g1~~TRINITY_DN6506_c0_g1_i1.p1  ORF type:complete len:458 (-),score=100.41 TRINITY_DN6506_c0_g1_i1:182-1555(-)
MEPEVRKSRRTKTSPTELVAKTSRRQRSSSVDTQNPKRSKKEGRKNRSKAPKEKVTEKSREQEQEKDVPLADWFSYITGTDETTFAANREKYIEHEADGYLSIKNSVTGRTFKAGKFEMIMYGDMLLDVGVSRREQKLQKKRPFPLIEIVTSLDKDSTRFVDVAYLQSLPENRNAIFQIASNFNSVEAITESSFPDSPNFTTKYFMDRTQGPAASISCGAGAITRVHAAFFNERKDPSTWGQTKDTQVNFLQNLSKHYPTSNGYVVYTGDEPKFSKNVKGKKWKKMQANYYVAYHKEQEVVLGHRKAESYEVQPESEQLVDQVCCAAVNMLQGTNGINNRKLDAKQYKMRFILQAAYDSTYLSAVYHERQTLFLTFVGGGAFGNDIDLIWNQILKSHQKWARHTKSKISKVVIIMFSPRPNVNNWVQQMTEQNIPYNYIGYREGKKELLASFVPPEL